LRHDCSLLVDALLRVRVLGLVGTPDPSSDHGDRPSFAVNPRLMGAHEHVEPHARPDGNPAHWIAAPICRFKVDIVSRASKALVFLAVLAVVAPTALARNVGTVTHTAALRPVAGAPAKGSVRVVFQTPSNNVALTVKMQGLKPGSRHRVEVRKGTCASQLRRIQILHELKSTTHGSAISTTTARHVRHFTFGGWVVVVRATANGGRVLACGRP